MRPDSRQIIHMGINYVVWPIPAVEQATRLRFEQSLLAFGVELTSGTALANQLVVKRDAPQALEIRLIAQGAQPQVGQILVKASPPERPLNQFVSEVEAILDAFKETWPAPNRQILSCDAALECLYQSTSQHAFMEVWQERLNQSPEQLGALGRRVLGGGLRFVMPPQPEDPEPTQVEVRIESFLRNSMMLFVSTQFMWPEPKPPGIGFDPAERLNAVDSYVKTNVHAFLRG